MKKSPIFYLIAIAILCLLAYLLYSELGNKNDELKDEPKIQIDHTTTKPDLSNGSFTFENEEINLTNGKAELELPENKSVIQTTLTDKIVYGNLNGDAKEDAAALFVQEGTGTGVFVYVAAYVSGTVRYSGSNAIFIGDRILPQEISINNEVIKVTYLDRKEGEPFTATPTEINTKSFIFVNNELKELR